MTKSIGIDLHENYFRTTYKGRELYLPKALDGHLDVINLYAIILCN